MAGAVEMQMAAANVDKPSRWFVTRLVNIASNRLVGGADAERDHDEAEKPSQDTRGPAE